MPRIQPVAYESAGGKAKELMDNVHCQWGMVPNLLRTFAHAPAVLQGYLGMADALAGGVLPAKLREQIALTVAERNGCDYCLAAHSAIGKSVGLSEDSIADSRRGTSADSKQNAALGFARHLVEYRARVNDDHVDRLRSAGYSEQEIVEIIAHVALNIFTNYFNHVAGTELDFPPVTELISA